MGVKGEALGIVKLVEAFAQAEELDTDLVEIAPKAAPPVCRLWILVSISMHKVNRCMLLE